MTADLPFALRQSKIVLSNPVQGDKPWECFPMVIQPDGNLRCVVQDDRSGWWEHWNLEHTLAGIRSGFYKVETAE